jgi:signal transduction histidine kinase
MKHNLAGRSRERVDVASLRAADELESRIASATAALEDQNDHLHQKAEELRRAAALAADLLARVSAERLRFRFLAETSALLSASLDYETTLASLSRVLVPTLADGCGIFLANDSSTIRCVATAHADPAKEPILQALAAGFCKDTSDPENLLAQVMREKRPIVVRGAVIEHGAHTCMDDPEAVKLFQLLTVRWVIAFPFVSRDRVLGGIVLYGTNSARECEDLDRVLVQEIASRAAIAVDNAMLYQEAQRAISARENLMAIVSHDMRNSLSLVLMSAALLDGSLGFEEPRVHMKPRVDMIRKGLGQMRRLIEDLLDFASLESGHLSLLRKEHEVTSIVGEAVEAFQLTANAKNIRLEDRVMGGPCRVYCDRDRILQVLANVMGNAMKFTPAGGTVTVRARVGGDDVEFSIADSGCGIAKEELPRVFEAYFRASRPKNGGTGLGLYIAKGVVESHGGHMWVESRPGAGTTFYFSLPRLVMLSDDEEAPVESSHLVA